MELYDKLTAKFPANHFSTSTTQTVIEEDDPNAITRVVTFEHSGIEVLKIDKALFVVVAMDETTGIRFVHTVTMGVIPLNSL